ncbi:MAG: hypothetical protein B6D73_10795 [gamma proteobacterium symbiont of Stewartia floridana]|nr:MAG: hypothetical protein B6D73_10795 [gamma proteobacterium symbiont of Stewartia floridana]
MKKTVRRRGRQPNAICRKPADFYRTKTWARLLKDCATPDLSRSKAEQGPTVREISTNRGIGLPISQWKEWWDGSTYPNKKTAEKFDNDAELNKLLEWLKPAPYGHPMQRHFVAIDALVYSYSTEDSRRDESLKNAAEIMDAIHHQWAPLHTGAKGVFGCLSRIEKSDYGIAYSSSYSPLTLSTPEDSEKFQDSLSTFYDPFLPNSIIVFMLALKLYNLLPTYHHDKHWVLDLVSALMAMHAFKNVKNIQDELATPSVIGNMADYVIRTLEEETQIDALLDLTTQISDAYQLDEDAVVKTLLFMYALYHEVMKEIDLSPIDIGDKLLDAANKNLAEAGF